MMFPWSPFIPSAVAASTLGSSPSSFHQLPSPFISLSWPSSSLHHLPCSSSISGSIFCALCQPFAYPSPPRIPILHSLYLSCIY